jgi:hypothetical protein
MNRTWTLTISIVLGATAGWAAYFAWQWRALLGGQEFAAGLLGAFAGLIVWALLARRG